jgi:hypothetical protein
LFPYVLLLNRMVSRKVAKIESKDDFTQSRKERNQRRKDILSDVSFAFVKWYLCAKRSPRLCEP